MDTNDWINMSLQKGFSDRELYFLFKKRIQNLDEGTDE